MHLKSKRKDEYLMESVIEINNLVKKYGTSTVLDNVTFDVKKGEILGFLGPNGAGKSTTMNILTGYISSSGGSVRVCGYDILENPNEVKRRIGYLPEIPPLYMDMTVSEYLNFVYNLKKVKLGREKHLKEVMNAVDIYEVKGRLIKNLSKGYKQRVGLAQALVGNPEVLVLDEPTVGLDPRQIIEIRNVIKKLGTERTIILSTHILQEVSAICDRVVIINRGKIAAEDTITNLSGGRGKYLLRVETTKTAARELAESLPEVASAYDMGIREKGTVDIGVEACDGKDIRRALFRAFAAKNIPILLFKPLEKTLEEIFIGITSGNDTAQTLEKPVTVNESEEEN